MSPPQEPLVDRQEHLEAIVARCLEREAVAVDTEFVWERTYYPHLGVVQLGLSREEVYLLDATALDLRPLGALLAEARVTKLLHDASQDLAILYRSTGAAPAGIFDLQLAAGFVGLGASVSLQGLIRDTVGLRLPKDATRTDWLRRPLSPEQLAYAQDDVRYLPEAFDVLRSRLEASGRAAWVREEMAALADPSAFAEEDPAERYRSIRSRLKKGFGGREYAVLRELAAWREDEARRLDRPRGHVLSDEALAELAQRKPTSVEALARVGTLPQGARQRYGAALVEVVRRALARPPEEWPERPERREEDPTLAARLDLVLALIRGRGQREGVDPTLVATRAEVEALLQDPDPRPERHPLLRGWRRAFVGSDVEALLAGRAALALDADGLPLVVPVHSEPV